jgi:hypothetical protein
VDAISGCAATGIETEQTIVATARVARPNTDRCPEAFQDQSLQDRSADHGEHRRT